MEEKRGNRQIQTVIGKETSFQGTISSTENIQIDGKQEGEITTKGTIIISETGEGQGTVNADNLFIAGKGRLKLPVSLKSLQPGNFRVKPKWLFL